MIFHQFNLVSRLDVLTNVLVGRVSYQPTTRSLLKMFTPAERALAVLTLDRVEGGDVAVAMADAARCRLDEAVDGPEQSGFARARAPDDPDHLALPDPQRDVVERYRCAESCTALVEHFDGSLEIIDWSAFQSTMGLSLPVAARPVPVGAAASVPRRACRHGEPQRPDIAAIEAAELELAPDLRGKCGALALQPGARLDMEPGEPLSESAAEDTRQPLLLAEVHDMQTAAGRKRRNGLPERHSSMPETPGIIQSRTMRPGCSSAPTAIRGAIDALAIYVHKDNPLECLSLQQVDAIFSKSRNGGHSENLTTWGQVGLTGEWANRPMSLYGRNSASGTYGYFKEVALFDGDYKDEVKEQPGSSTVVQGVASDIAGVGYSGVGYKTADVRSVPISTTEGEPCYDAVSEHAVSGAYPIARFLYVYVNKNPNEDLDPVRGEFIRFIYSREGQEAVVRDGYFPVTKALADQDLGVFGLLASK
jgi:hypothetical protein